MEAFMQSEVGRVAVAGSGFLADGYDLFIIGQVETVLEERFLCGRGPHVDPATCMDDDGFKSMKAYVSAAALWGAVLGQICFGTLADRLGRRLIFIVTGSLIILGSLLSACVQEFQGGGEALMWQLVVCRALLGFGIGGEYPLSATICAEGCSRRRSGTLMALVFSNQGLGYLLAALVMLIQAYAEAPIDFMWRFALAFGAVVPCISLYFRAKMHESEAYTKVAKQRAQGDNGVDIRLTVRRYAWHVLGTAGNWFIVDVAFYANGLFNGDVTSIIDVGPGGLRSDMLRTLIIVLIMLPGYFVGVALINKLGRKNVQLQGYANMFVWFGICGLCYDWLRDEAPALFIVVYGLTFFFANFGPNLSTYVIPGEIYPSQAKATLHGVSAAMGKAGAAVGSMVMPHIAGVPVTHQGLKAAMLSCAVLAAIGFIFTVFFTPRYGPQDLEPKEEGETVGFVPLRWQRATTQKYWAEHEGQLSEEEELGKAPQKSAAADADAPTAAQATNV